MPLPHFLRVRSMGRLSGLRITPVILLAALLSGAGALGLQVTWTRRLAISLGHELPALLGVVTVFFLGLGLGGWWGEGAVRRARRPGRLAAGIELGIAGWALFTVPLISWFNDCIPGWRGPHPGATGQWLPAFLAPTLALLPATLGIGAMFPITGHLLQMQGSVRPLARYYAVNTAGALVGVILALCWWQPAWGFPTTTVLAAALHGLAGMAFLCTVRIPGSPPVSLTTPRRTRRTPALWLLAFSGLLGMGFEVVEVRLLSMVLGGTVYSYAVILGLWLAGTATGAALWSRCRTAPWQWLPWALAGALVAAGWGLARLPLGLETARASWGSGFAATTLAEVFATASVMFPVTLLLGAWFSELLDRAVADGFGAGHALAANTLAGAVAPAAFGAILFPWLGSRFTWLTLIAGYLALGCWHDRRIGRSGQATVWMGLGVALVAVLVIPRELSLVHGPPGARVVWNREGAADTVTVWEYPDGNRSLTVDNRFAMGGTAATNAAARHAHLPLLMHPQPRRALFLGLGTGLSFAAAGDHPDLVAEGVELVPEVVAALPQFSPYNRLRPGLEVVTGDARCFVRSLTNRYDVIIADLFHPDRDGAGWLYTREHFAAIRSGLNPGGLACQWLPWFQLDATARAAIIRAWSAEFPGSEAWLLRWTTVDTPVVGLVGWKDGVPLARRLHPVQDTPPGLRERLRICGLSDDWQFWGCWLGMASDLLPATATDISPMNTDEHPVAGWTAARRADRARQEYLDELLNLLPRVGAQPPRDWLEVDPVRWGGFRQARNDYLRGLAAAVRGRREESDQWLWASAAASSDFPSAYSHLLSEAMRSCERDPRRRGSD